MTNKLLILALLGVTCATHVGAVESTNQMQEEEAEKRENSKGNSKGFVTKLKPREFSMNSNLTLNAIGGLVGPYLDTKGKVNLSRLNGWLYDKYQVGNALTKKHWGEIFNNWGKIFDKVLAKKMDGIVDCQQGRCILKNNDWKKLDQKFTLDAREIDDKTTSEGDTLYMSFRHSLTSGMKVIDLLGKFKHYLNKTIELENPDKFIIRDAQKNDKELLEQFASLVSNVKHLSIKGSQDVAIPVARAFIEAQKGSLESLKLESNKIGPDGAKDLADALKVNKTLQTLVLWGNNIGDDGAKDLAKSLENNKTLQTLHLRYNFIGDDGAKALADTLKLNKTLQTLDLEDNNIGNDGAKDLARSLKGNTTLQSLSLSSNNISHDAGPEIKNTFAQQNPKLEVTL